MPNKNLSGKPKQGSITSLRRIADALVFSMDGFWFLVKHETAFKQQLILGIILIFSAFCAEVSLLESVSMIVAVIVCWLMEIINTAIESISDAITESFNENIRVAKNLGSLAVLISYVILIFIWSVVLLR